MGLPLAKSHERSGTIARTAGPGGADPPVRGRRPRRPAGALQDADIVVPGSGTRASRADRGVRPTSHQGGFSTLSCLAPPSLEWATDDKNRSSVPPALKSRLTPIMDRPAAANPATARDIILEIVRNMRPGLAPLHYSTLPPAVFHIYLHPSDMERLRGILPRILDEARRALDAELESLNKASLGERLKLARRAGPKAVAPEGGWQIQILENTDEDVEPGDIAISSELALPSKGEIGSGTMTKRIATRRMSGVESTKQSYVAAPAAAATPAADASAFAVIEYDDRDRKSTRLNSSHLGSSY